MNMMLRRHFPMVSRYSSMGRKTARIAPAIALALFLSGCQAELYSNLPERDVKDMVMVLQKVGIEATTTAGKDGKFSIEVERSQLSAAITELSRNGLPRKEYGSLGDIFAGDKLVSTPFEERARFMYALNEELADSLTRISGITSARVHLMLPETSPFDKGKAKPRAAVFIYKAPGADLSALVPVVKNLIVNSLDGLEYENVEVAMFDGAFAEPQATGLASSVQGIGGTLVTLGILAACVFAGLRLLSRMRRGGEPASRRRPLLEGLLQQRTAKP
jgi:type III secretion protein J